jgi:DNA-binding PadR family transcriptional regulator
VLLRAETTDAQGIDINQICLRCPLSRNTIYPIISRLVSARWVSRQPETPQSRRSRAGPGKGGPPHMLYSLSTDGHIAALHELSERRP